MIKKRPPTTAPLVLDSSDSTLSPPINRGGKIPGLLMHEPGAGPGAVQHPVVPDLRGVRGSELVVGHVSILVEPQVVRLVHFVHSVDVVHVDLEHVESPPLLC